MLVISVRPGETTTITTPTGEVISVLLLRHRTRSNEHCLGIAAPEDYTILRAQLREKMLSELEAVPVFEVSSQGGPTRIVVASDTQSAVSYYRRVYPNCSGLIAHRLWDIAQQRWYSKLENSWLLGLEPPFMVDLSM